MRIGLTAAAISFLAFTTVALAKPPADVADLVGARAPGAEIEMQNRGYVDVRNNNWWNDGTKTCVPHPCLAGQVFGNDYDQALCLRERRQRWCCGGMPARSVTS